MMEILDYIEVRSLSTGDLIQFQAWIGDESYTELMFVDDATDTFDGEGVIVRGRSEIAGDFVTHILDPYLEVELMGA